MDDDPRDDYHRELKNQFNFLKQKYELHNRLNKSFWKFLRLRPANFPTLRLSQFAALLHENSSLFDQFLNITDHSKAEDWIKTKPSAYWRRNYTFGKASKIKIGGLGKATSDIIIINVVVPLLISYGKSIDSLKYIDRGFKLLEEIKPEKNKIVRLFQDLELSVTSALDTQALIQLHSEYCNKKECLRCSIGNYLVKPK